MSQPVSIIKTPQGPLVGPYIFGKTLGTGSTGKVKLAKNLETGEVVAIKIVRKDFLDRKPSLKKKMKREISVLKLLSHPNVMGLIDVFEIETHLFLVMEFVDGVELFEYLVRRGPLPTEEALDLFHQIICGVEYCHRRLICHRDLKPENLLLDRQLNVKIADFGMTSLNVPGTLLETSCGSPHYCDPMVVSGEAYDGLKADWSCGVILYAMVTGRLPFDDDNIQRLLLRVQSGMFQMPQDLPDDLQSLIKAMLTVDPEQRITLEGIKAHPWFNRFPPKKYPVDNFEASSEPICNPDLRIVASLSDLGWGDCNQITEKLSQSTRSMEKVFYVQLQRHPMFSQRINSAETKKPQLPSSENASAMSSEAPSSSAVDIPSKGNENVTGNASSSVEKTANQGHSSSRVSASASWHGLEASNESRTNPRSTASKTNLVRQSQLIRSATESSPKPEEDSTVEEAIQNVGGVQKSWFDSVRDYLTGQTDENNSKVNKERDAEN